MTTTHRSRLPRAADAAARPTDRGGEWRSTSSETRAVRQRQPLHFTVTRSVGVGRCTDEAAARARVALGSDIRDERRSVT